MTTALSTPMDTTGTTLMKPDRQGWRILVAGLGNVLLRDDGVGVHVVQALQSDPSPDVLAVELGTAVLDGLHLFEQADRILAVDALRAGGRPGTIYTCGVGDIEEPQLPTSLHELNLRAAFRFLPHVSPPPITILGIEPERIDYGLELSPAVQSALPQVVQAAREIVARWAHEDVTNPHRKLRPCYTAPRPYKSRL